MLARRFYFGSLMMRRIMASERVQQRIEERLDRADAAIDSDEWLVVRELARDVLDLDPENVDAAGLLAMAGQRPGYLPYGHMPQGGEEEGTGPPPQASAMQTLAAGGCLPHRHWPRGDDEEQPQSSPEMGEGWGGFEPGTWVPVVMGNVHLLLRR